MQDIGKKRQYYIDKIQHFTFFAFLIKYHNEIKIEFIFVCSYSTVVGKLKSEQKAFCNFS